MDGLFNTWMDGCDGWMVELIVNGWTEGFMN
jgi:hypothetical protein